MRPLAISIPVKKVSAWIAETEPRHAREWLASLPLADSAEAARELYQALYTLNRLDLDLATRFELMELYRPSVAAVTNTLHSHFARAAFPLSQRRRQLAEFVRQLHLEMAYGYKCCLWDQQKILFKWGKKQLITAAIERAIFYLGNVLLRSYLVYIPNPARVWKEIHELYRFAEASEWLYEPVETAIDNTISRRVTINQRYLQLLLLGICNPYQLPQSASAQIAAFLQHWADKARILPWSSPEETTGQFVVNFLHDAPPIAYVRGMQLPSNDQVRLLDTVELVRTVHSLMQRLKKGESLQSLNLGFEYLGSSTIDLLERMGRAWGGVARRRYTRIKRHDNIFLSAGLNAIHFFASGQKPFSSSDEDTKIGETEDASILPEAILVTQETDAAEIGETTSVDEVYIALDEPESPYLKQRGVLKEGEQSLMPNEIYRVDRWQVHDLSPQGMLLRSEGETATHVRVGDLVGLQRANEGGQWSIAVTRWLKNPNDMRLDMGIELLAAEVEAIAVKPADGTQNGSFVPALRLPAMEALQRPSTLILPRGVYREKERILIRENNGTLRAVKPLRVIERSGSFEHLVVADIINEN